MPKATRTIQAQLREAIETTDLSVPELGQLSGVQPSQIYRFLDGKDLRFSSASALADALGLHFSTQSQQIIVSPDRKSAALEARLAEAGDTIQILTTRMTVDGSFAYVEGIVKALVKARPPLKEVTILASHPENKFLGPRASQLGIRASEYKARIPETLRAIAVALRPYSQCKLLVYKDFPLQIWYRIDEMVYVCMQSIGRRTSENCLLALPLTLPSVKKTFIGHFEELRKHAEEYRISS